RGRGRRGVARGPPHAGRVVGRRRGPVTGRPGGRAMNVRAAVLGLGLAFPSAAAAGDGWRYVVPPPGDPFANPPPRALALRGEKPAELAEEVAYRGSKRRYARLTYGAGRAAAVDVVVDEVSPGEVDLYVDAD